MEAVLDIGHWGNSLGVRLLVAVISPVINKRLTLKQRLALFDSKKHGGEAMKAENLGKER